MAAIFRLKSSILSTRRIDAWHYQPEFMEKISLIERSTGTIFLEDNIDVKRGVAGGATPLGAQYLESGNVRFYRTSEVDNLTLDGSSAVYISDTDDDKLKRSRLKENDILLTITGAKFGKSAVVEKKHLPGNISQHSVRFSPESNLDSYFLIAYLSCHFGQTVIWREAYGATRPAIDFPSIRSLPIPNISINLQVYIGNKVRQAELLREWGKSLEDGFIGVLKNALPEAFENRFSGKKYSKATPLDIGYTLNPGAFNEERLRVQSYLTGTKGVKLSEVASVVGETTSNYTSDTTYIGLNAISSNSCQISPSTIEKEEVKGTCRLLHEGPVIAKLRPYLNKVSYIPKWLKGSVGSTELMCVKPKGELNAWYLYGVLKSEVTLKQIKPVATGATHPRIDKYDLNEVIVPVLAEQESLGLLLEKSQKAYFESSALIEAAKRLVESLIEGKITETEIVAAQQALENDDNTKDRVILSKLTDKGYAVKEGKPLFSDLDALYELLDEAQQDKDQY